MRRGFERALDECLSQLNTGEVSLEEVLARYPQHEAELRPLLRTAMLIRQVPQAVPSPQAKAAGRQRLLAAVAKKKREKVRPSRLRRLGQSAAILVQPLVRPQRQSLRLAQAIAALLIVVSFISAGTVGVAAGSLPDSPLYAIKRTTERVQLALTTTPAGKARLHMNYSVRRLEETLALWEEGKGVDETTLQAMESANNDALTFIGQVSEAERLNLLTDFTLLSERQQGTLEEMQPGVLPADQEVVEEALEVAEEHQSVATEAMTKPDLLLTPQPERRPTDTATPVPPTFTATLAPTDTPVPPTFTWTPVPPTDTLVPPTATPIPTPTPVPPTATPIPTPTPVPPTATPTPQSEVPFTPAVEPTATPTPQSEVPFTPAVEPTATPTPQSEVPFTPAVEPTETPTPQSEAPFTPAVEPTETPAPQSEVPFLPTVAPTVAPTPTFTPRPTNTPTPLPVATPTVEPTPTPTPTPTNTPTPLPVVESTNTPTPLPVVEPTATPTPQAEVPFQPAPVSAVTNCRVSDTPQGKAVPQFPAGTGKVYVVFDYAYMAGEEVGIRVYNNSGNSLFEEVRTLSGDGTISVAFSAGGEGGFVAGRYVVNIYDRDWGVIKTTIWDIAE